MLIKNMPTYKRRIAMGGFMKISFVFSLCLLAFAVAPAMSAHAQSVPQLTISAPVGSAPATGGTFSALSSYQLNVSSAEKSQNVELFLSPTVSLYSMIGTPEGQTDANGNWSYTGAAGSLAYGGGGNYSQNWAAHVQFPDGTVSNTINFTIVSTSSVSCELSISPASVASGGTATLTWLVQGSPTSCTGSGGGSTGWTGMSLNPTSYGASWTTPALTATTQFGMSCLSGGATVACSGSPATVTVTGSTPPSPPTVSITGVQGQNGSTYTNGTVTPGQYMDIYGTFGATNNTVTVNGTALPAGDISYQGTSQINVLLPTPAPSWLTSGTVTVTYGGASASATFSVASLGAISPAPNCSFSATPSSITIGSSTVLGWGCSGATSCSIDNNVGTVAASTGFENVAPSKTTTYTLSCTGAGGGETVPATVTVTGSTPPSPPTVSITGVQGQNGSTYTNGTVTPGQYMDIYGTFGATNNTVTVNGTALPAGDISYQGTSQINVLLPTPAPSWLTSGTVTVTYGGATSNSEPFTVTGSTPPPPTSATASILFVHGYNSANQYIDGTALQGTNLDIQGSGFDPQTTADTMLIDGAPLPASAIITQGVSQIDISLSGIPVGNHTVSVRTSSGTTNSIPFSVQGIAAVTGQAGNVYTTSTAVQGTALNLWGVFGSQNNAVANDLVSIDNQVVTQNITYESTNQINISLGGSLVNLTVGSHFVSISTSFGNMPTVSFNVSTGGTPPSPTNNTSPPIAAITGVQGWAPPTTSSGSPVLTTSTVTQGTYLTLYGTFGPSGNIVLFDGTIQTSTFLYQGMAQINLALPLLTTGNHTVAVKTISLGTTDTQEFTVVEASGGGGGNQTPPGSPTSCAAGYVQSGDMCVPIIGPSPVVGCTVGATQDCNSAANSCDMINSGTETCSSEGVWGTCSATMPPESECSASVCLPEATQFCSSSANSCGMTNAGTQTCDSEGTWGACSAILPPDSSCSQSGSCTPGASCDSTPNACGMTNSGTVTCNSDGTQICSSFNGAAVSSQPDSECATYCTGDEATTDPDCVTFLNSCKTNPTYPGCPSSSSGSCTPGASCDSTPNACGMTNSGTVTCNSDGTQICSSFNGAAVSSQPDSECATYCTGDEATTDPDCVTFLNSCKTNPTYPGCPSSSSGSCTPGASQTCDSSANSCGMTNAGAQTCDNEGTWGECSAMPPSDNDCTNSYCQDYPDDPACASQCASDPTAVGCTTDSPSSDQCASDPTAVGCTTDLNNSGESTGGGGTSVACGVGIDDFSCIMGVKDD